MMLALVGCRSAVVPEGESVLARAGGNGDEAQLDFWHGVAGKKLVSNDEAFHGVRLFLYGKDDAGTYADRVAALKREGILSARFEEPGDVALTRGTLAVALVNALHLKHSVSMKVLGVNAHHAIRELEYEGIYPASSENQVLSGAAFVGVIGKAHDYLFGNSADYPAAVMPSETPAAHAEVAANYPAMQVVLEDVTTVGELARTEPIFASMLQDQLTLSLTSAPATTTTAPATNQATITAVEGLASYRENEGSPWKKAAVGTVLGEAAELRTGPNGAIQLRIEPGQTIGVDRLTTVKLLKIFQQGNRATTDIGIKYGRTRYDLEGGGIQHQSTLRSPNATLAVRGTRVSLFDQPPFTPQAVSLTGRAEFQGFRRQAVAFGNRGQGRTVINTETNSPGELALRSSTIDPTLHGERPTSEVPLVENLISRGATVTFDRGSGLRIIKGGTVPRTDAELAPLIPGQLAFVLRWTGNTNLDLAVSTPNTSATLGGEFVYPVAGLAVAPSGGRTAFDHQGGKSGGIEVVFFNKDVTNGIYSLAGPNVGTEPAVATLDAFYNGKRIKLFDGTTITQTVTQTVTPGQPALALASVGSDFPFQAPPRVAPLVRRNVLLKNPPPAVMVGPKPAPRVKL
ncbi:MAG TPA: hypothetical protein VF669_02480 [Tepidisphaeraceae bacterium]